MSTGGICQLGKLGFCDQKSWCCIRQDISQLVCAKPVINRDEDEASFLGSYEEERVSQVIFGQHGDTIPMPQTDD